MIPSSVTSIGKHAFSGCNSLRSITLPFVGQMKDGTSNAYFGYIFGANSYSDYFENIPSSLTEVIITGGSSIDNYAFYGCGFLTNIVIPNGVTSIGNFAFNGCDSLTSMVIPNGVMSIGDNAFRVCSSLISVDIPSSVTSIGSYAFQYCRNLTNIVIPSGVTSIGKLAFQECDSLTIYCEAESKPSGWESNWNYSDRPVIWGYKG